MRPGVVSYRITKQLSKQAVRDAFQALTVLCYFSCYVIEDIVDLFKIQVKRGHVYG